MNDYKILADYQKEIALSVAIEVSENPSKHPIDIRQASFNVCQVERTLVPPSQRAVWEQRMSSLYASLNE